ncbi:GGDEF domain-containing protein [Pseudoduganella namucuonensis]|uniref:diguanylate cyclase n=1 Tax=Pseudoduganella namucuonensis TaxID=1035707 RepID=A0A1I7HMK3_9BURK|nr:GGDEF domain-containing protein [Pseudoduganella namucuonensis]SFU61994.1 diguanylate cyclase (GGDEF) domain-containing protein [Pseudoduganella namucuonensis]
MNQPPSRAMKMAQYLVGLLLLLTPTLLIWQHFGMTRVLELSPRQPHGARVTDDRYEKGNTVASLVQTRDALVMRCELGMAYQWPFCKLQFLLGEGGKGVDFSQFDTITFDMNYEGPSPRKIRLYLINFEPELSTVDDWNSQRFNQIEFELPAQPTFTIPVNLLRTADWWKDMRKVPLAQTYTRLDNVTAVELSTGGIGRAQVVTMELRSIQFRGKWISKTRLLMYLVYAWIACGIFGLSLSLLHFRSGLLASQSRLELLATINKALELEARELADQAHTDPLTGALNRQGLREALMRRLQTPEHYGEGMAVVFMDLDHFKQINDRHGHNTGDEVLRHFAAIIRREVRASDKLVRWGGEEFLLVCPETHIEHAAMLAEKLRVAMTTQEWPHGLRVTSSFGVTELKPEEDIGAAITRADSALYAAKSNGRNRVEVA